jgi:hypothetical protein
MRFITTRVHGVLDYSLGLLVMVSPWLFGFAGATGPWLHLLIGILIVGTAAMTDFELGMVRLIPMPVHLMLDVVIGLVAIASPWLVGLEPYAGLHVVLGLGEIGIAAMTSTHPARRRISA